VANSIDVLLLTATPASLEKIEHSLYDSSLVIALSTKLTQEALAARVIVFDLDSFSLASLYDLAQNFDGSIIATYTAERRPNILGILQHGIDDCMDMAESRVISARVKRLLDRSKIEASEELQKNGWLVNKQQLTVLGPDNTRIPLTTNQAILFIFLFEHEGVCISREYISSQLYGSDWTYGNRKIDVSVSSLRKKLKQVNAPAKIHTISGQGYLLSVFEA